MKKISKIDFGSDRLIGLASDLVDDHNYIGALKLLNKNAQFNFDDEDSLMLYAEIFDDMALNEKCINGWFRFLDYTLSDELTEAYEGLAVAYMNIGNETTSAYYYDKLLIGAEHIDSDLKEEIMSSFLEKDENPLKFVYPPEIADFSGEISSGIEKLRGGDCDGAIEEFSKVPENNPAYLSARNYIAMCEIIGDKCDDAEKECLEILKKYPDNVHALTTLAAVRTEQDRREESRELAVRLINLNLTETEDIYKVATVCCENKMHAEAFNLFEKLESDMPCDCPVLYFKAVSAFNSGNFDKCFSAFDKLLAIKPESPVVRFWYKRAREAAESGEKCELSYFYRLPQTEREQALKIMSAAAAVKKQEFKKIFPLKELAECILWTFDETGSAASGTDLQILAATCAEKYGLDHLVRDILLNAFLSDELKIRLLYLIAERNEDNFYGVVVCNLYKRISFRKLEIGAQKRKNFVSVYAKLASHFSVIDPAYSEFAAAAAEILYSEMRERGTLSLASDADALTAAVYYRSHINEPKLKRKNLGRYFGADENKLSRILGDL